MRTLEGASARFTCDQGNPIDIIDTGVLILLLNKHVLCGLHWLSLALIIVLTGQATAARATTFEKHSDPTQTQNAILDAMLLLQQTRYSYEHSHLPVGSRVYWAALYGIADGNRVTEVPFGSTFERTRSAFIVTNRNVNPSRTWKFSRNAKLLGLNKVIISVLFPGDEPGFVLRQTISDKQALLIEIVH